MKVECIASNSVTPPKRALDNLALQRAAPGRTIMLSYEKHRITSTRCLFQSIQNRISKKISPQEHFLCDFIVSYTTYQKRLLCSSLLTNMAKTSCTRAMDVYIKRVAANNGNNGTLLQNLRADSGLILRKMKRYGAECREYDMLGEMFVALLKGVVVPLERFKLREVDVKFWVDVPVRERGLREGGGVGKGLWGNHARVEEVEHSDMLV